MGYHVVDPGDLEPTPDHPCDRRSITEAIGLNTLSLAVYDIDPGDELSTAYHYHEHREEAFLVVSGRLHVETPDGPFRIDPGDVFVVEPGNPHRGYNPADADGPVRVVGMGAPLFDRARPVEPGPAP